MPISSYRGKQKLEPYLLVLPVLLFMAGVLFFPLVVAFFTSLQNFILTKPRLRGFVGLNNYRQILSDPVVPTTIKNAVILVVASVSLQFSLGLAMALILNRRFFVRGFYLAIIFSPWAISPTLGALMWKWMFHANLGVLNDLLTKLRLITKNIAWLATEETALPSVILLNVWKGIPFFALMLLAGLQAIPLNFYEVADIEGATSWQKFVYITLPQIKYIIAITILLRIIWIFNLVDIIFVLTEGGPVYATETIATYVFKQAYTYLNFGYGAALSVMLFFFLIIFTAIYLWLSRVQQGE